MIDIASDEHESDYQLAPTADPPANTPRFVDADPLRARRRRGI